MSEKRFPDDYEDDNPGVALWEFVRPVLEGWPEDYIDGVRKQCQAHADVAAENIQDA